MPIPNVSFKTLNGALGGTNPTNDGIAGLILSHAATSELELNTPKAIYSVADAEALLIEGFALEEIKDFYGWAGDGQELWIMIVSDASLLADICDKQNDIAKKLLTVSQGRIRFWGVNIDKPGTYVADQTEGIDSDVYAAMLTAHALAEEMAGKYIPTRVVLPAREWNGDASLIKDLKTATQNRVQLSFHGRKDSLEGRVGFLLGLYSSLSVQRNIGRVANGDLGITEAYYTDGVTTAEAAVNIQETIHDKGYVIPMKRFGKSGYFYNDDPTATANSDDFASFARGRVIDKVQRIAYEVYLEFVNDDYQVSPSGGISVSELKRLQGGIDDAINAAMTAPQEISGFQSFVDPNQDTLATGQTVVKLATQPRAYHKDIVIESGFTKTLE
jgi:hypothetical protein